MKIDTIDSKNFDKRLRVLLNKRGAQNVLSARFNMEDIGLPYKTGYLLSFISMNLISGVTYKISYWEKDSVMRNFFRINFPDKSFTIKTSYKGQQTPGIIFVDDENIDESFFRMLLQCDFNHEINFDNEVKEFFDNKMDLSDEMKLTPSFVIKVQICLNLKKTAILLDICDDKEFLLYFLSLI